MIFLQNFTAHFQDENCDPLSGLKKMNKVDHDLPKSATINKENKLAAGPWNKQGYGMKKHVPKAPSTPSFQGNQRLSTNPSLTSQRISFFFFWQ